MSGSKLCSPPEFDRQSEASKSQREQEPEHRCRSGAGRRSVWSKEACRGDNESVYWPPALFSRYQQQLVAPRASPPPPSTRSSAFFGLGLSVAVRTGVEQDSTPQGRVGLGYWKGFSFCNATSREPWVSHARQAAAPEKAKEGRNCLSATQLPPQ